MKKLGVLVFLLFLSGCNQMTGATVTFCVDVQATLVRDGVGVTILEIEGYNEDILTWTVSTTLTRAEFSAEFLDDTYLSDEEIHDLFARYNTNTITGVVVYVSELTESIITIRQVYNYEGISNEELSRLWGVDDFTDVVTLSRAIEGLVEQGATCTVFEVIAED